MADENAIRAPTNRSHPGLFPTHQLLVIVKNAEKIDDLVATGIACAGMACGREVSNIADDGGAREKTRYDKRIPDYFGGALAMDKFVFDDARYLGSMPYGNARTGRSQPRAQSCFGLG